jgi:hypothetical protein
MTSSIAQLQSLLIKIKKDRRYDRLPNLLSNMPYKLNNGIIMLINIGE